MKYRVAICDDLEFYVNEIEQGILKANQELQKDIEIYKYTDPDALLLDAVQTRFDLAFLDVEMPQMDGLTLLTGMREHNEEIAVVFVTSHEDVAFAATQKEILDFIAKPASPDRVARVMKKAIVLINGLYEERLAQKKYIDVCVDREKKTIAIDQILYIEKYKNRANIISLDGQEFCCYETLKSLMEKLDARYFLQINGGTIVNMRYVTDIKDMMCSLETKKVNTAIPISRTKYKLVKAEFFAMLKKRFHVIS